MLLYPGNLLIRPRARNSKSPYNFDIVLLDHGLYFDLSDDLRINYSKFWLSLIAPPSKEITEERKKYAKLVGNVDEDLYPIFEAAITGEPISLMILKQTERTHQSARSGIPG